MSPESYRLNISLNDKRKQIPSIRESKRARVNPSTSAQYPLIRTATRLHMPITLKNSDETHVDLDTSAEYDIVSEEFAHNQKLPPTPLSSLSLRGIALERLRTHSIY